MRIKRTEQAEQTGRMPLPVKCVAIFLTLAVLAGTALYCWLSYEPNSYTVCSDDGYYSETTYYRTEEAFERAQEGESGGGAVQVRSIGTDGTAAQKEAEGEFVSAATKTVWVSETVHESGAVLDSHLMTDDQGGNRGGGRRGNFGNKTKIDHFYAWYSRRDETKTEHHISSMP